MGEAETFTNIKKESPGQVEQVRCAAKEADREIVYDSRPTPTSIIYHLTYIEKHITAF